MPAKSDAELMTLGSRIMRAAGADQAVAERVVRHLIGSNLVGIDSHGIMRLPHYVSWLLDGRASGQNRLEVLHDLEATCLIDAHFTYGAVAASEASRIAREKAHRVGVGLVSVRNSTHTGRLGEYMEELARDGFIGMICCNAQGHGQFVAPWGGSDARLTTNPIAWGFPSGHEDRVVVVDMATSASPEGRIRLAHERGESLPNGHIIDKAGNDTTNPADLFGPPRGAILPFGQHKGYALALVVEMLSGALSGGGSSRPSDQPYTHENAFFLMAIRTDSIRPLGEVMQQIDSMIEYVTSSPPVDPAGEVLIPYQRELRERQRRLQDGLEIAQSTWDRIVELAASVGVSPVT